MSCLQLLPRRGRLSAGLRFRVAFDDYTCIRARLRLVRIGAPLLEMRYHSSGELLQPLLDRLHLRRIPQHWHRRIPPGSKEMRLTQLERTLACGQLLLSRLRARIGSAGGCPRLGTLGIRCCRARLVAGGKEGPLTQPAREGAKRLDPIGIGAGRRGVGSVGGKRRERLLCRLQRRTCSHMEHSHMEQVGGCL